MFCLWSWFVKERSKNNSVNYIILRRKPHYKCEVHLLLYSSIVLSISSMIFGFSDRISRFQIGASVPSFVTQNDQKTCGSKEVPLIDNSLGHDIGNDR